jgi:hypothetical protein
MNGQGYWSVAASYSHRSAAVSCYRSLFVKSNARMSEYQAPCCRHRIAGTKRVNPGRRMIQHRACTPENTDTKKTTPLPTRESRVRLVALSHSVQLSVRGIVFYRSGESNLAGDPCALPECELGAVCHLKSPILKAAKLLCRLLPGARDRHQVSRAELHSSRGACVSGGRVRAGLHGFSCCHGRPQLDRSNHLRCCQF